MTEKFNPFTGKGDFQTPTDTPYKKTKFGLSQKGYRRLITKTKATVYRLKRTG